MSDSAAQAGLGDAALDAALACWSADPRLAPLFRAPGGIVLVLDAQGGRVLHASDNALALQAAITDPTGQIRESLRLAEQIRPAALPEAGARLTRLRFDARRIARPTACLVARAGFGGDTVLLLAPAEPLPALRPVTARPTAEAPPEIRPEPPVETPAPAGRIVWRSDADGVLTRVSGAPKEIAAPLTGRSWQALAASGEIAGADLLAAIDGRQTFRTLALTLRPAGSAREIDIVLSGAPSARPAQPFAGFAGFGLIRGSRLRPTDAATEPQSPLPDEAPAPPPEPTEGETAQPPTHDRTPDPIPPPPDTADRQPERPVAHPPADEPAEVTPLAPSTDEGRAAPVPAEDAPAAQGPDLSTNEHAAFREIARALGARFAGDDESARPAGATPEAGRHGAVMAFPVSPAQAASSAFDAAVVAALDRLPAGVLVHRDSEIVFVNRRFLQLAEYPDREALQAAGGLVSLLGRTLAHGDGASDEPVSVTTGGGGLLALLVERSRVDWGGGPAELLLVRTAAQTEQARERIAQGLFEARDTAREREAHVLLDQIEEGVATLDEDGRVIALNRSAAAILSGDARELVGGPVTDLFATESGSAVEAALREARETGAGEPREARPRTGPPSAPLRLRIARFSAAGSTRFCATLRESPPPPDAAVPLRASTEGVSRADFLARVGHEIRMPVGSIIGHAEAMLSERDGALGNERHRDYLRDIRTSGEQVLGVLNDLVDLARIEAGRIDLTFTDVALNDVVSNCIALMQPQAARDRIVVRTSLSPDLKPLVADERCMRQATLNVIANAIRLSEAGGQVIVSTTTAERGEIAFRVRDTGTGMTQAEIDSALEPFHGTDAAVPRAGLGLTLTKALVEANRGRLRITSRKNEGTLVEMLFPADRALSA